jgi:excinuclease ABC subunit C
MPSAYENIKSRLSEFPDEPGCYLMKDKRGKIFYIGKAKNLKRRIKSYFLGTDERPFVAWLEHILVELDTIVVRNETESMLLEQTLIRQHKPRFNILLKDDKNYILLRLDSRPAKPEAARHRRYGRLEIVRQAKNDGARYFGPYPSATQLRTTLHLINKYFHLRSCSDDVIDHRGRPCIQHQIGRCPAPCVREIPTYGQEVENVTLFLNGQSKEIKRRLEHLMWQAAKEENYESAARLRDQARAVDASLAKQAVTQANSRKHQDVIAMARRGDQVEFVQLVVRKGRTLGAAHFSFGEQTFPSAELMSHFLLQLYERTDAKDLPHEILVSVDLKEESNALEDYLLNVRHHKVKVLHPQRGKKADLIAIAHKNAELGIEKRLKEDEEHLQGLEGLRRLLGLSSAPKVIECFDVSLFQGTDAVASKVSFTDGMPNKNAYRRYTIKTVSGTDDYAMLHEVITRRLERGLKDNDLPNLLLIDGGKGQLHVALAALRDLKIPVSKEGLYVASIAKARTESAGANEPSVERSAQVYRSPERLFVPGVKDPLVLLPHTKERYLIERIRNEAHRFAITTHRGKRKRRTLQSQIDALPGVGKVRRAVLFKHFGSFENLKRASFEDIEAVPGIGKKAAELIYASLRQS